MTHSPPHSPGQDMEFVLGMSSSQQRYLPLSPAQFDSHARTSRSHSLHWPRRLFLKTYRLFILAQIHAGEARATRMEGSWFWEIWRECECVVGYKAR